MADREGVTDLHTQAPSCLQVEQWVADGAEHLRSSEAMVKSWELHSHVIQILRESSPCEEKDYISQLSRVGCWDSEAREDVDENQDQRESCSGHLKPPFWLSHNSHGRSHRLSWWHPSSQKKLCLGSERGKKRCQNWVTEAQGKDRRGTEILIWVTNFYSVRTCPIHTQAYSRALPDL